MFYDASLVLCGSVGSNGALVGQACNGAGNITSTNTIDMGPPGLGGSPVQLGDPGTGEPVLIHVHARTTPVGGTSVRFQLIQADDALLTVGVQVLNQTDDLPLSAFAPLPGLPAGRHDYIAWPPATFAPKRFVGMRIVNTGPIANLSVFACVVAGPQDPNRPMRSGYSMS